jgi:exodeoxyribonuclease VII large subunit
VFACRTPVISAIGHESDTPLVDFVADVRASTPTDAAKRVVPDLGEERQRIGQARTRLDRAVRALVDREQHRLDAVRSRPVLARPEVMVDTRVAEVAALRSRSGRCLDHRLERGCDELAHTVARLRALSPAATLHRGYAIVQRPGDGAVLRDPGEVTTGDALRLRLAGGELAATVSES